MQHEAFTVAADHAWIRRDGLGLPDATVQQTRAGFLLDEAACGQDASDALPEACRILPGEQLHISSCDVGWLRGPQPHGVATGCAGIAGGDLPLSFVTALADRGAVAAALAVQQARVKPAPAAGDAMQALQEAEAVLYITMQFGLVHEAFCQVRRAAIGSSSWPPLSAHLLMV